MYRSQHNKYNNPIAMNSNQKQQKSSRRTHSPADLNSSFSSTMGINSSRLIVSTRRRRIKTQNTGPNRYNCSLEKKISNDPLQIERRDRKRSTAETASSIGAKRLFVESPIFSKPVQKSILDDIMFDQLSDPESSSEPSIVENTVLDNLPNRDISKKKKAGDFSSCSNDHEVVSQAEGDQDEEFCLDKVVQKLEALAEEGMTYQQFRRVFIPKKKKATFTQYCYLRIFEKELIEM